MYKWQCTAASTAWREDPVWLVFERCNSLELFIYQGFFYMDVIVPCNHSSQTGTVFINRPIDWFKIQVGVSYNGV